MNLIVRKLIAKELYVHRWLMLGTALATMLAALACAFGRAAFHVGSIAWITAVIACGVMLAIYGVAQERKEHSLQFVLSLPVSARQHVFAKMCGLLLAFALPWLVATASAVILVLAAPGVANGFLPFVVVLCGFLLANFSVLLCGVLHARSEPVMVALVVITNMGFSVYMFLVGALPGIRDHSEGPVPVWNATVLNLLWIDFIVLAAALTLPLLTAARRRDLL